MAFFDRRPSVGRLSRRRDIEGLARALRYQDLIASDGQQFDLGAEVRVEAVRALAGIEDERVTQILLEKAFGDPLDAVRLEAVLAVHDRRGAEEALIDAAATWSVPPYGAARAAAVEATCRLTGSDITTTVVVAILERDEARPLDQADYDALDKILLTRGDERLAAGSTAVSALADERPVVGARAGEVLGWLGESGDLPVEDLVRLLREGAADVRCRAAQVLGVAHETGARTELERALSDPDRIIRRAVVQALGELHDPRAVSSLLDASVDTDFEVRRAATAALDALGTVATVVAVISAMPQLSDDHSSPGPSAAIEHPPPVPPQLQAAHDASPTPQENESRSLQNGARGPIEEGGRKMARAFTSRWLGRSR